MEVDERFAERRTHGAEVAYRLVASRHAGVEVAALRVHHAKQVAANRMHQVVVRLQQPAQPLQPLEFRIPRVQVRVAIQQAVHDREFTVDLRIAAADVGRPRRQPPKQGPRPLRLPAARHQEQPAQPEPRVGCGRRFPNDAQRSFERADMPLERVVPSADGLKEVGNRVRLSAGQRMLNRLGHQALPMEPARGDSVQARRLVVKPTARPLLQELREQPMVAVPDALPVKVFQEQVPTLKLLQRQPGIVDVAEQVGEIAVDPLHNRRLHQENLQSRFELVEHLLQKVVGQISVAPGQLRQHRKRRHPLRQPAMHAAQGNRPTLGAPVHLGGPVAGRAVVHQRAQPALDFPP